jgi:hypothetical protein
MTLRNSSTVVRLTSAYTSRFQHSGTHSTQVLFGNEGSSLRTSWIRRSGVMRHSNQGHGALGAGTGGAEFMSSAAAMTTGAGMNGINVNNGSASNGVLGAGGTAAMGGSLQQFGGGLAMGNMPGSAQLMFVGGGAQPSHQLLMSPAAVASVQTGRAGGGSETFSLSLLLQQQQQMAAAALAAGAPAALQHVNAPHSPQLPTSGSLGQLSAAEMGGSSSQTTAGTGLPGFAAPPSSPLPGGSKTGSTTGSIQGGTFAPPSSLLLPASGSLTQQDRSSMPGLHRAPSGAAIGEVGRKASTVLISVCRKARGRLWQVEATWGTGNCQYVALALWLDLRQATYPACCVAHLLYLLKFVQLPLHSDAFLSSPAGRHQPQCSSGQGAQACPAGRPPSPAVCPPDPATTQSRGCSSNSGSSPHAADSRRCRGTASHGAITVGCRDR